MTDAARIRMRIGSDEWEIVLTGSSPETAGKIVEAVQRDLRTRSE